jgi:drug/metabolite transporter superfamily protein YnfA
MRLVMGAALLLVACGRVGFVPATDGGAARDGATGDGDGDVMLGQLAQQAYLKASNNQGSLEFGTGVAMSGDTLAIGGFDPGGISGIDVPETDDSAPGAGAVYVIVRAGTTWIQQAFLKASNVDADDAFGEVIAIDGDTLVIGARYEASAATGVDGDQGDNSAPQAGAAYVFVRSGTTWSQQAYLKASNTDAGDEFGANVAISGDTIVVTSQKEASAGDPADNSLTRAGAAYVFTRSGATWSQQAYLKPADPTSFAIFGVGAAITGDTIAIGAPGEASRATGIDGDETDTSLANAGAAYVFVRAGSAWSQQAYLKAASTDADDSFGQGVALAGDTLVVGCPGDSSAATTIDGDATDNSLAGAGAAYVFARTGTTWSQQAYLKVAHPDAGDQLGTAVAIAGNAIVSGAPGEASAVGGVDGDGTDNSAPQSGAAYAFVRTGTSWAAHAYLKAAHPDAGDTFGVALAIAGGTIASAAIDEASGGSGTDADPQDNSTPDSGAVYVFE